MRELVVQLAGICSGVQAGDVHRRGGPRRFQANWHSMQKTWADESESRE